MVFGSVICFVVVWREVRFCRFCELSDLKLAWGSLGCVLLSCIIERGFCCGLCVYIVESEKFM